jgi:hypothetical protein
VPPSGNAAIHREVALQGQPRKATPL